MSMLKKRTVGAALVLALAGLGAVIPATAASAGTGATGTGCTAYQYSSGGYASCIGNIQRMLNGISYVRGGSYGGYSLSVDNKLDANTNTQVRRFQSYVGITSDGIVGRNTWNQLCRYAGARFNAESNASSTQKAGWQAAYDAGCWVDKPGPGRGVIPIHK